MRGDQGNQTQSNAVRRNQVLQGARIAARPRYTQRSTQRYNQR